MKILHLLPSLESGGMETFVLSLAKQQRQDGLEPSIAIFSGQNKSIDTYIRDGISIVQYNRNVGTWRLGMKLKAQLINDKFDLLHTHNETSTIFGALSTFGISSVKFICTIHNGDRGSYSLKQRIENYLAFRRCDAIVSVTEQIVQTMSAREFVGPGRIRVIKNGIKPVDPTEVSEKMALKKSLSIKDTDLVVGCVGRLVPVKNHILFLSAFKSALPSHPNMVLILVGDGPLRDEIKNTVHSLGLEPFVRLLGDRKDVPALLNMMDMFALPSLNEGHSISVLEAFSAGKPVIASNRGGNPTLVTHGLSGLLVDPEDINAMAEAIKYLATNPEIRSSMGAEGRMVQKKLYGMEICSRNYLELYRSLQ